MTRKELFETIKNGRDSYKEMVEFCADSMILNNDIIPALQAKDFYFDFFCGSDYDEEEDCYIDFSSISLLTIPPPSVSQNTQTKLLCTMKNLIYIFFASLIAERAGIMFRQIGKAKKNSRKNKK